MRDRTCKATLAVYIAGLTRQSLWPNAVGTSGGHSTRMEYAATTAGDALHGSQEQQTATTLSLQSDTTKPSQLKLASAQKASVSYYLNSRSKCVWYISQHTVREP
eukprot:6476745-Amphidinium_carterae.1